jgi:TPR repeat protein
LGLLYASGHGVEQDAAIALQFLEQAAHLGDAVAQADLANKLLQGNGNATNQQNIARWFRAAAQSGDAAAAYNLGLCFFNGIGVARDETRAAFWIAKAAERLPEAQFLAAQMLADGRGFEQDLVAAREYFRIASASGLPEAVLALGEFYALGYGGSVEPALAEACFRQAAQAGNVDAMYTLALHVLRGGGNAKMPEALEWAAKAAQSGHEDAAKLMGDWQLSGIVAAPDEVTTAIPADQIA